jgi:hypothetical protein
MGGDGFDVVPDSLRRASSNVSADAADVGSGGTRGAEGATAAGGGAGDGPLAGALGALASELNRCSAAIRSELEQSGTSLDAAANLYLLIDDGVASRMTGTGP